jgi:predicted XRE-type DNA-binding protein
VNDDPIWPIKRQLADAILELSAHETWLCAARRFGIDPSRMCDLRAGRITRFSVERLVRILATVGRGVELRVVVTTGPERICWRPRLRARRDAYLEEVRRNASDEANAPREERADGCC